MGTVKLIRLIRGWLVTNQMQSFSSSDHSNLDLVEGDAPSGIIEKLSGRNTSVFSFAHIGWIACEAASNALGSVGIWPGPVGDHEDAVDGGLKRFPASGGESSVLRAVEMASGMRSRGSIPSCEVFLMSATLTITGTPIFECKKHALLYLAVQNGISAERPSYSAGQPRLGTLSRSKLCTGLMLAFHA
jgi:hypothetical protein